MPDIRGSGNAREFRRLFPSRRISCITGTAANLANHCLIPPHNIPSRSREFSGTGSLIAKRGRLERRAGGVPPHPPECPRARRLKKRGKLANSFFS